VPYPTLNQPTTYGPKQTVPPTPPKTTPKKIGGTKQNKTKPHSLPFVGEGLLHRTLKRNKYYLLFKPCVQTDPPLVATNLATFKSLETSKEPSSHALHPLNFFKKK